MKPKKEVKQEYPIQFYVDISDKNKIVSAVEKSGLKNISGFCRLASLKLAKKWVNEEDSE